MPNPKCSTLVCAKPVTMWLCVIVGCVQILSLCYLYLDSLDACRDAKRRLLLEHPDVTCLYTSNKIIGDKKTDQRCLVIGVRKKKKESELEEQRVLPKMIPHGWYRHLVDVVEEEIQLLGDTPMQRVRLLC